MRLHCHFGDPVEREAARFLLLSVTELSELAMAGAVGALTVVVLFPTPDQQRNLGLVRWTLAGFLVLGALLIGALRLLMAKREPAPLTREDLLRALDEREAFTIPHSKTNQLGQPETVILPRQQRDRYDPVAALDTWLDAAGITAGPVFHPVTKGNRAAATRLSPAAVNELVQGCITAAGFPSDGYSAHSLRAGFVTYAVLQGQSTRGIARQTRHRSLASVNRYTRIYDAWDENAATEIRL